jgi:hypothetical protein
MANFPKPNRKNLPPPPPPSEAKDNLAQPEHAPAGTYVDGRSLRATGRTTQFTTRITEELQTDIKVFAAQHQVEVQRAFGAGLRCSERADCKVAEPSQLPALTDSVQNVTRPRNRPSFPARRRVRTSFNCCQRRSSKIGKSASSSVSCQIQTSSATAFLTQWISGTAFRDIQSAARR